MSNIALVPGAQPGGPGAPGDASDVSLLSLVNAVLRRRDLVLALAVVLGGALGAAALLGERTWTSDVSFIPQSGRPASPASGIAAQLGFAMPSGDAAQSPQFYADLVGSRSILQAVAESTYVTPAGRRRLVELYGQGMPTPAERENAAVRELSQTVSANAAQRTGVIRMSVRAPAPTLARDVARNLLAELDRFNRLTRQSQAAAERQFTETRLRQAEEELRRAEDRRLAFLVHNRGYEGAPTLLTEYDRLSREVERRSEVVRTLSQAFERARIDEVRDTPVLTVIDPPTVPVRPDPRGTVVRALLGVILGVMLGIVVAVIGELTSRPPARPDPYDEFARLRRESLRDVVRPWRPLRRLFTRSA